MMYRKLGPALLCGFLLLSGCSTAGKNAETSKVLRVEQDRPAKAPAPQLAHMSPEEAAAAAQGLKDEQILNRAAFVEGRVGNKAFHGGQILLWESEPNVLTVRASLLLGDGKWRSTNTTASFVTPVDRPFLGSVAMLNDVEEAEMKVPLWAFFGRAYDPGVKQVEVQISGANLPLLRTEVHNNTWLVVYQGIIHTAGPPDEVEFIAYDAEQRVLFRDKGKLP